MNLMLRVNSMGKGSKKKQVIKNIDSTGINTYAEFYLQLNTIVPQNSFQRTKNSMHSMQSAFLQ